jgi:hypothetical protein
VFSASGKLVEIVATQTDVTDRKRAEGALRRNRAYLAEAQQLSCTGSFGWRIADNLVDLQPIVRENVYDEKFGGSFSIKKVLPALVPGLGYDDLRIGEAETASVQLARVILGGSAIHPEEREELRQALLEYCKRDTAAMVALSNRLAELAS